VRGRLLLLLAFTGGLVSLGLEIAASRLLAPFFGTSTPIWGALIGLILLYLTIGYWAGGRLADRHPDPAWLYRLTAAAAALALVVPPLARPILLLSRNALAALDAGAFVGALLAVILLFAPAVILLGMVSPWVIRLRLERVERAGSAAGAVYALSTAGSILGAFLPAFWWIPSYGTRATILGLGATLLLVSAAGLLLERGGRGAAVAGIAALPLLAAAVLPPQIRPPAAGVELYESESEYGYIQVTQVGTQRRLILNEGEAIHSVYDPESVLTGGYWDWFTLSPLFAPPDGLGRLQPPRRALIVGLAGGTVARELTAAYPGVQIDGVEIDPRIIDVGRRWFDMTEPNLHPVAADGRWYLETSSARWDLIVIDAYRQPYIPFQLTTREFFEQCREHLTPGGVLAVNVGRAPDGDRRLVDAITGTLDAAFVDVYQMDVPGQDNTVVFAPQRTIQPAALRANLGLEPSAYPGTVLPDAVVEARTGPPPALVEPHQPIWTDDLAPVERLVDSIILDVVKRGASGYTPGGG
jgi:spermidine synthase